MDELVFIQKCVQGDRVSWRQFVEKYSRLIFRYILAVIQTKGLVLGQEQLHDLFQETLLLLVKDNYRKLRTFQARNGCTLASWLRQVVIHATIDYLRSNKFPIDVGETRALEQRDRQGNGDVRGELSERLSQEEKLQGLAECIDELGDEDKYIIELHMLQQLPLENIRHHLGLSRGAIDMRKARILEKLKNCFGRKGFLLDSLS